jgi:hypothetical protein
MAISGAAVSANMGGSTVRPLTPTMTMLNVRLGYWLRNPRWVPPAEGIAITRRIAGWFTWFVQAINSYFFLEMFGRLDERSRNVYLTDGGHIENLGAYELLKRRCRLIIVVDAEADPAMKFGSFVKLQRHARIDLGIRIELPWPKIREATLTAGQMIAAGPEFAAAQGCRGPHCAVGIIRYPHDEIGYLLYVKASLTGDEADYVIDYKRRYPLFPHEPTGDQLFTEEQFEVYRSLGFHVVYRCLNVSQDKVDHVAVHSSRSDAGALKSIFAQDRTLNSVREILGIDRRRPQRTPSHKGVQDDAEAQRSSVG